MQTRGLSWWGGGMECASVSMWGMVCPCSAMLWAVTQCQWSGVTSAMTRNRAVSQCHDPTYHRGGTCLRSSFITLTLTQLWCRTSNCSTVPPPQVRSGAWLNTEYYGRELWPTLAMSSPSPMLEWQPLRWRETGAQWPYMTQTLNTLSTSQLSAMPQHFTWPKMDLWQIKIILMIAFQS